MGDVSITPGNVVAGADADYYRGTAGATITAGQVVYLDSTDNTLKLAESDASAAAARVKGLALHGASADQPLRCQTGGTIVLGAAAAPVLGRSYMLSETAGGIAPIEDLALGDMYGTHLGFGVAGNALKLGILASDTLVTAQE